ncbi:peptidyl-tRNA hydrolase Pth2 [Desulfurococcaceae archaeon MEX13E-LK6-19]|nr:peptidyl-tRNA hydrolase Pth2 [Desulfurococcaceae archaeon MEX13E-LK6-19]
MVDVFNYKQVIVVRTDISMSKGKLAVQVAHAAVSAAFEAYRKWRKWFDEWFAEGQKKVVVKVSSEKELLDIAEEARRLDLPVAIIRDAGLTELPPGTLTAVGIGPAPSNIIDKVTGRLKLL